jgi:hypothetical protein
MTLVVVRPCLCRCSTIVAAAHRVSMGEGAHFGPATAPILRGIMETKGVILFERDPTGLGLVGGDAIGTRGSMIPRQGYQRRRVTPQCPHEEGMARLS